MDRRPFWPSDLIPLVAFAFLGLVIDGSPGSVLCVCLFVPSPKFLSNTFFEIVYLLLRLCHVFLRVYLIFIFWVTILHVNAFRHLPLSWFVEVNFRVSLCISFSCRFFFLASQ